MRPKFNILILKKLNLHFKTFCTESEQLGEQSISDKKLEVVAVLSSFHIAQMQVGCSKPLRIGQANSVKVNFFIFLLFTSFLYQIFFL